MWRGCEQRYRIARSKLKPGSFVRQMTASQAMSCVGRCEIFDVSRIYTMYLYDD